MPNIRMYTAVLVYVHFFAGLLLSGLVYASDAKVQDFSSQRDTSEMNKIVIFGASYAQNWKISEIAGYSVINKGLHGNETSDMLDRINDDVIQQSPEAILVWGFINDIFRSAPDKLEERKEQTKKNLLRIIEIADKNGIKVLLATEVTITSPKTFKAWLGGIVGWIKGKKSYADNINEHVREVNQWLVELGKQRGIVVLDFESALSDGEGGRKSKYAVEDGSHLSDEAYQALTDYTLQQKISL